MDALLARAAQGDAIVLDCHAADLRPRLFRIGTRAVRHVRHWHKYVTELLPQPLRFYFYRADGVPAGAPAGNLVELHRELAHCDPVVIAHHARRGDLSRWAGVVLGDGELAGSLRELEIAVQEGRLSPEAARPRLLEVIEQRYLA